MLPAVDPARVAWNEGIGHIAVQPVQVDVRQDGTANPTLWCPTVGLVEVPVLQVPRVEQSTDEAQKPPVVDLLPQHLEQKRMVEAVKAVGNVALNEPHRPGPGLVDVAQGGVASPSWPKPMRAVGKLRLVVRL